MRVKNTFWFWGALVVIVLLLLLYGLQQYTTSLDERNQVSTVEQLRLAHQNYTLDIPSGWEKVSDGSTTNQWSTITYRSPDLKVSDIPETNPKGGIIHITISPIIQGDATIEEILHGIKGDKLTPIGLSVEQTVSRAQRAAIDGLPAVEYVWSGVGMEERITTVDKDGLHYSIEFFDETQFNKYSKEYYSIVKSFRFLK